MQNLSTTYGKQFNIAVANTYGSYIVNGNNLPSNSIIINSPVDSDFNDIGAYSVFVTDLYGNATQLSYTIKTQNGLYVDDDILTLNIDNSTIIANENTLQINTYNLIDNDTVNTYNNRIYVNTSNIKIADSSLGVVKLDGTTIVTDDQHIFVNTDNLQRANNTEAGVVTSDNDTISISNDGAISVNTQKLVKSTNTSYGVSKPDGSTINSIDGIYGINTSALTKSTTAFGVSKPDGSTINSDNGVYKVNTQNLTKASNTEYGVVKLDNRTIHIDDNMYMSLNNYSYMTNKLYEISYNISNMNNKMDALSYIINNYEVMTNEPIIHKFNCVDVTSTVLTKSKPGTLPINMEAEKITVEFIVNTNCPFNISVDMNNNIEPSIFMYEINYDNVSIYPGTIGLGVNYQSTNNIDKIVQISFMCKNYASSNNEYTNDTKVIFKVNAINNVNICKEIKYTFIRFNSLYNVQNATNTNYIIAKSVAEKIQVYMASTEYNFNIDSEDKYTKYDIDKYLANEFQFNGDNYMTITNSNDTVSYGNGNDTVELIGKNIVNSISTNNDNEQTIITLNVNEVKNNIIEN